MALWSGAAFATEVVEVNLEVVGRSGLDGGGPFGDVAVVGTTAVVAGDCPGGAVSVVDVKDPRRPTVVATLATPAGMRAAELDAAAVLTPTFAGDLLAVSLAPCGPGGGPGAAYYDVSDAAEPELLAEAPRHAGGTSVSLAQRDDGRVLALRAGAAGGVVVEDLTEPRRPAAVGRWSAPPAAGCRPGGIRSAVLHDDGLGAVVVLADGRVSQLNLTEPAHPAAVGDEPPPAGGSGYAAVLPVGTRTLAIVADQGPSGPGSGEQGPSGPGSGEQGPSGPGSGEQGPSGPGSGEQGFDGACPGEGSPGLRVLELSGGTPVEREPVRFTTGAAPGRLVASGELAYVTWNADGLRVVDLAAVRPRVVAQFIPARAAVVGVGLLADHVVVVDRSSGLYVLERPEEAGGRSSFWSDLVGLLPYLGFAGILAGAFVIPRLAMGHAPGRAHVPSPAPEPTPRAPRRS